MEIMLLIFIGLGLVITGWFVIRLRREKQRYCKILQERGYIEVKFELKDGSTVKGYLTRAQYNLYLDGRLSNKIELKLPKASGESVFLSLEEILFMRRMKDEW